MKNLRIWRKGTALSALLLLDVACGSTGSGGDETANLGEATQAIDAGGTWHQVTPFPEGIGLNLGLLTDGRVIISNGGNHWYTLTRDVNGSYANGTWDRLQNSPFSTRANPSWILNDGRYMICTGEHVTFNDDRACTIYDPVSNQWSAFDETPERVGDTPSATLPDGRPFYVGYASELHTFAYTPSPTGGAGSWWQTASVPYRVQANEGASLLLSDGSVLLGGWAWRRYVLANDAWYDTAPTPGQPVAEFSQGMQNIPLPCNSNQPPGCPGAEIGPLLLLHDGRAMILGGSTKNGLYTPPTAVDGAGSWAFAADTPNGLNHGDSPGCVETTGNVLAIANPDPGGGGQNNNSTLWEYQVSGPLANQWLTVTEPDGPFAVHSDDIRMVALPSGEVMITGHPDGNIWLYTPNGASDVGSAPVASTLTSWFGQFRVDGTGLNGTSTGADFGDDAKMATNFPTVMVDNGAGTPFSRSYPRTYGFDSRVPDKNHVGYFYFGIPSTLPPGNYRAWVNANGITAQQALNFTIPVVDAGIGVMRAALWNL